MARSRAAGRCGDGRCTAAALVCVAWDEGNAAFADGHRLSAGISALSGCGADLLLVVARWGIVRLRLATCSVLVVLLVVSIWGWDQSSGFRKRRRASARLKCWTGYISALPLAERIQTIVPPSETVAVFRVRRDMEYGLAFYRNHEVANYDEVGVPPEEHVLVVRVAGRGGVDLRSQAALSEYLEGRHYEPLFQLAGSGTGGVQLVGSR